MISRKLSAGRSDAVLWQNAIGQMIEYQRESLPRELVLPIIYICVCFIHNNNNNNTLSV